MPGKTSHYEKLKEKLVEGHRQTSQKLFDKHREAISWALNNTRQLAIGGLSGAMLLSSPVMQSLPAAEQVLTAPKSQEYVDLDRKTFLIADLDRTLPKDVRTLTKSEEGQIEEVLSRNFGIKVRAELDGKRLNTTYGIIGAEQHLARYSGDTMETHFDNAADREKFYSSGMAPGLGGWGYFGSDSEGTSREKYYIAVQSFLAPNYQAHLRQYIDFLRFRKMLVVNPENGKALVADIGDAGPAEWTGKHLGGSPEVMDYLEREDGARRGPVLYFFIDDPNNETPFGPIDVR